MRTKSIVVLAAALLLVASVAPAVATDGGHAASIEQNEEASDTAAVTHDGTAVENVSGDVNATDGNETNETAANESFGAQVSAYVHELLNGADDQRRIGRLIASWVVENNPGNAPDHAGPPDHTGQTDGNVTATGPSENPGKGNGHGPPEHAGSNGNGR